MNAIPTPLVVRSKSDLNTLMTSSISDPPRDILLDVDFSLVERDLKKLCQDRRVYSVIAVGITPALRQFAGGNDEIPVFCVESIDGGAQLASRLRKTPHDVVRDAINGEAVALKFLQGSPS